MADDGWDVVDDGWDVAQPRDIRETAKRRLAALGGKPESEKGDFAPRPSPIAGNAIPAIEPVNRPAIAPAAEEPDAPSALLTPELQSFFRKNKQEALRKARENTFPSVGEMAGNVADWAGRQKAALDADLDREAAAQAAEDAAGEARHDKYIAPLERRVGDLLTGAGAAAREAIGGYGDISPDATPIQRARLRRRAPAPDLAGGGVRKYEPPKAGEPYLPLGAGVEQYRPVSEQAAARLAALRSGDDGTVRRENARPLFEGKALGEAPATSRLNPEDTLRATAPARYLENDYTKVHDWAQGAADDLGKWATEDTEHSALARLVDRGENSDSLTANLLAAGAKGVTQAITSSAPALAEFAVLHRATPGAFKPLVDAAITSWFSGEGIGQVAEASPAVGTDIGSAIGGDPVPFNELAQHLGQLGMGTFMGATPLGAKSHIAKSIEGNRFLDPGLASGRSAEQARLYGEATRGQADREMASRAISVEEGTPMIGAFNRQPMTAPLTSMAGDAWDFLSNRQQPAVEALRRPRQRGGLWQDAGLRSPHDTMTAPAEPEASFTGPIDVFDLAAGRRPTPYAPEMGPETWEGIVPRLAPFEPPVGPPVPYSARERLANAQLLEGQGPPDLSRAERAMHSIPSGPEGQVRGPFPVPPDVLAQGRTPPADLQARTGNAPRPAPPPVDPATLLGRILENPQAPETPMRPTNPAVGDVPSWQDRQRAERASPAKPPAEENIQVEPKATTDAQLEMVDEGQGQPGKKPGVLYTVQGGAKPPDVVPEGLARVDGPAGTLIFDPAKVTPEQAREALTSGEGLDKALGFSGPRPEPHPDNAVVSVLGKDGVEKSSQVAGPTTFRTEQGGAVPEGQTRGTSSYSVDSQGRTTRTKGQHFGHDTKDVGVKTPSDRTVYVDEATSTAIGGLAHLPKGTKATVIEKDGRLYPATWNDAAGKWGLAPSERAGYPIVSDTPKVGLHPIELWGPREGPQGREYRSSHAGNRIVEVAPGDIEGAVKAAQGMAGEGDQVAVRTPDEVIADRQAGIEAEKKPPVERRVEDKGPEGRLHFVDPGQVVEEYRAKQRARVLDAMDKREEEVRNAGREQANADERAHIAERIAAEHALAGDQGARRGGLPAGDEGDAGPPSASARVEAPEPGPATEVPRAPEPGVRPAAEPVAAGARKGLLDERARSIEERRELQRKIREDSLSPKKLARAKEELRETELHLKALDKKLGYEAGGPTAAQVEADLKERFGDRYEPDVPEPAAPTETPSTEPRVATNTSPRGPRFIGNKGKAALQPNEHVRFRYELRDASDVITSHDDMLAEDPRFDRGDNLQPRDRERDSSREQIEKIEAAPDPLIMGASPTVQIGAPWLEPAGDRVAVGNGRTIAHRRAYRKGSPAAERYRQMLRDDAENYGFTREDVDALPHPMLVRVPLDPMTPEQLGRFADYGNRTDELRMSPAERSQADARRISPATMSKFEPGDNGDLNVASNDAFRARWVSEVLTQAERAEYLSADGRTLLPGGIQRMQESVVAKGYGSPALVEKLLEGGGGADGLTKTAITGLMRASSTVGKTRMMVEGGEAHKIDFTAPITEALTKYAELRKAGTSIGDFLDQGDMFGDPMSPEARQVLSVLEANKRSAKGLGNYISAIARALENAGDPRTELVGAKPTISDIYGAARIEYEERHGAQGGLFGRAEPVSPSVPTAGGERGDGGFDFGPDEGGSGSGAQGGTGPEGGGGGATGGGRPGGGEPGVYGSPSRSRRALARSRAGGAETTLEPEPVRPGGPAPEATVRPDVEPGDGVYEAPTSAPRAATMTGSGKKAETNPRQIIKELERITGTPIRYNFGHFAQRGAEGWFNRETNAIRMKQAEDLVTGAHEAGHSLHTFALKDQQHFPAAVSIELTRLGKDLYGPKPPNSGYIREGMAEYVAKYLIGDDMTKDAPAVHSWVRANMPAEKLSALDAARELYEKWDVAGSVGRVKGKMVDVDTSFVSRMKDGLDKLVRMASPKMWTNKFSGLDEAMREVTDQLGLTEVHPMQDVARLGAALEKNATGSAYAAVTEGVPDLAGKKAGAGLKDALEKIPFKQLGDFAAYAYARRAVDLWERRAYDPDTKKRTGDPTPINPGISLKDAKQAAQQLESPEFRDALDKVTVWSNHLIDYVVKSGGLTPEEAVIIREANPVYVPLKRFFEESVQRGESGGGGGGLKRIKGSGRSVLNPVYSLVEHAATMIRLGDRLRVARAVADLVDPVNVGQSGTKGYGGLAWFAEKIQAPKDSTSFGVADIKKQLEAAGADLTGADLGRILTVFQNAKEYHGKQNIISIVRNGTREFYEVDPRVYEVLMRTEPHAVNPVMQALQAAKRGVQLGATGLNAGFSLVSNVLRDMPTSSIYSKSPGLVTPIDTFKAVWKEIQKSPEAQRWERGGGSMSTLIGQDRLASRRIIEEMLAKTPTEKGWVTFKHPVDALRKGLGIFESGPRIAEYERMLKVYEQKYGVDSEAAHLMAMLASKDVTVNFTRAGIVSEAINRIVPFFDPRIQGASKFYRTFGGDYLESRGTARQPDAGKAALAATAKAMAWITVPTFALWVANKDEEWYQELPAWQKGAFWVWSPDHGKTKYRIPKPMELGWVFGSLPEAAWDYAYRQNKRGVMDALAGTVNSLMPMDVTHGLSSLADLIPAGAKPLVEAGLNYDAFRNRPIVDPFLERRKLPKDQYQRQTSETAKKLGEWLNISPSKIDHVAGGLTGGLAIDAVKAMELAVGARKAGSIEGLYDVPVLNRLALRPSPGASVDHMHEQDALLRQKVGSKVATEEEKATLKRIAAAKTAIDHARLAAEGAKGDDLHTLNTWSTHMAQWALGKRAEMPEEELESLEEKFPSEEWGKAFKAMRRKIPTYEAEAPPE